MRSVLVPALLLASWAALPLGDRGPVASAAGANSALPAPGYAVVLANGEVGTFGGAGFRGDLATTALDSPVVAIAATADREGYWLLQRDGTVRAFGDAVHGAPFVPGDPAAGITAAPGSDGFWTVSTSGDVRAQGAAPLEDPKLSAALGPVVGIAASDADGAWLATSLGAVVPVGEPQQVQPPFPAPHVVGIAATPDGRGYWLVTATGMVLPAGDARAFAPPPPGAPVVALVPTPDGGGYLLLRSDGSVVARGDATFLGDAVSPLHPPLYPLRYSAPPTGAVAGAYLAPGPQPAASGPLRVAFLGDSLSVITGRYTRDYLGDHDARTWIADGGILGCGVVGALRLGVYSKRGPLGPTLPACAQWQQQYQRTLALAHPDAVVLLLGYWESQRHLLPPYGVVDLTDSPPYRQYVLSQLQSVGTMVAAAGARLVVLTAPPYGDGTPTANVATFNQLLHQALPDATTVDLAQLLSLDGRFSMEIDGITARTSDRVHLTLGGVQQVIDPRLVPVMEHAAQQVRQSL